MTNQRSCQPSGERRESRIWQPQSSRTSSQVQDGNMLLMVAGSALSNTVAASTSSNTRWRGDVKSMWDRISTSDAPTSIAPCSSSAVVTLVTSSCRTSSSERVRLQVAPAHHSIAQLCKAWQSVAQQSGTHQITAQMCPPRSRVSGTYCSVLERGLQILRYREMYV